jgi:hypothetical protein
MSYDACGPIAAIDNEPRKTLVDDRTRSARATPMYAMWRLFLQLSSRD